MSDPSPHTHLDISDEVLADHLVEAEVISRYQSDKLLTGRTNFDLGPYVVTDFMGRLQATLAPSAVGLAAAQAGWRGPGLTAAGVPFRAGQRLEREGVEAFL